MIRVFFIGIIVAICLFFVSLFAYGEDYLDNYGFYQFTDEKSAKDYLIDKEIDYIYDYEYPSKNAGGEYIPRGDYYIPIRYWDCNGSRVVDEDYIAIKDFMNIPSDYDERQDITINNNTSILNDHNNILNNHSSRLDNHENRLDSLEDTQFNLMGEVNILQGKRWKFGAYGKYNLNRNVTSEVGLKITIDLDKSWSVKELEKVNKRLEALESKLNRHNIKTETVKTGDKTWSIRIKDKTDAMKVIKRF